MPIRFAALMLVVCLALGHASAQKMPLFHTIDSLEKEEKKAIASLLSTNAQAKTIDDIKDKYEDQISDLRDSARDYADSVMEHMDKCSHFELGFDFASRQLIYGRKGPANAVEGLPNLKYMHWTGIYGMFNTDDYKLVYQQSKINRKTQRLDTGIVSKIENDMVLTAGFTRTLYDRWDLDAFVNHTFIFYGADKNYLASSLNINNSINFFDYISLDVYYSLFFGGPGPGKEKIYSNVLTFGLNHDFKIYQFLGAKVFTITPEFLTDVGNDNYARNRVLARNENGGLEIIKPATDNFFGLLNMEGGINFDYRIKNLDIYIDPRISIPFNIVPSNATSTAPYRTNDPNKPIFYVTAGIRYLFKFWKEKHPVPSYDNHKSKSRS